MTMPVSIKLQLTPLHITDEAFVYTLFSEPQVIAAYSQPPFVSKEEAIPFIRRITQTDNFVWLITSKATNEKLGIAALHHWDKNHHSIEIGGTLLPKFWGKGIMQESFCALISFAYTELNVRTIFAKTTPANNKALHLALKMGFEKISCTDTKTVLAYYFK